MCQTFGAFVNMHLAGGEKEGDFADQVKDVDLGSCPISGCPNVVSKA